MVSTEGFLREYYYYGSEVIQQKLNMTLQEKRNFLAICERKIQIRTGKTELERIDGRDRRNDRWYLQTNRGLWFSRLFYKSSSKNHSRTFYTRACRILLKGWYWWICRCISSDCRRSIYYATSCKRSTASCGTRIQNPGRWSYRVEKICNNMACIYKNEKRLLIRWNRRVVKK